MDEEKQVELQKAIEKLASEANIAAKERQDKYLELFNAIYANNFRHLYSGIFAVITKLSEEQQVNLEQNLFCIYQKAEEQGDGGNTCDAGLCKSLRKLYDHVSLDISRMHYWSESQHGYDEKLSEAGKRQIELDEEITEQRKKVSKLVKKLEKTKNEYITILGIFAAIILGAVGSLTYAGKVLEGAGNQSTDLTRLIIIAMVLGAVLVATINSFLSFILKINDNGRAFNGWRWNECIWLIVIVGATAIGITKLLGV